MFAIFLEPLWMIVLCLAALTLYFIVYPIILNYFSY